MLCEQGKAVASLNIKAMLRHLDITHHTAMFDAQIAAYLFNPLKSEYTYDDIAREYLGEMLPAKEDLLGKLSYAKAALEKEEELAKSICYMAYTALKARQPLLDALEAVDMKKLYTDMEMPLLFALSDMEKRGDSGQCRGIKRIRRNAAGTHYRTGKEHLAAGRGRI